MICKSSIALLLFVVSAFFVSTPVWAQLTIHAETDVEIGLVIYNGLDESPLFTGSMSAETSRAIDTSYLGLALLVFSGGQSYPVIIGDEPLTLRIASPNIPPSYPVGSENEFFYKHLSGGDSGTAQYAFAKLMIQAKKLLESSHNIHTPEELSAKKREFHTFVGEHYNRLKHSDMVRRLIAQYFMMHEYVNYHRDGAPASNIRIQYEKAVLNGVNSWLELVTPKIPDHKILNYIVSLYYNRSMVSLASMIMNNFQDSAYCPGDMGNAFIFPGNLSVTSTNTNTKMHLSEIRGHKVIAFVSNDCPVSMVETVNKARKLIAQNSDMTLIVAPLQELSEKHLAMSKMISGGSLFFIDDQKWREEQLPTMIKLPLFLEIEAE